MSAEEKPQSYIRARRENGSECIINLIELEDALDGAVPGEALFVPGSGRILFHNADWDDDEQEPILDEVEILEFEPLGSRTRFEWMEEFIYDVHSIPLQSALRDALRHKKPFRDFKDVLLEYPNERQHWFQFEKEKLKAEAVEFIKSLDWEILEILDVRPAAPVVRKVDLAERLPLSEDEHMWILRGAWEVAAHGGRTQLALLLKGSKNKQLLKHGLQMAPPYGRLSFLTIEEIENRIDQVIRRGELRLEFFGDLPLILLTDATWEHLRPWANQRRCEMAAAADDQTLFAFLTDWKQLPRGEQIHLVDTAAGLSPEISQRILKAFHSIAGKEVKVHIEGKLSLRAAQ
jgi:hypothetical protein